jgi:hypothetical protein
MDRDRVIISEDGRERFIVAGDTDPVVVPNASGVPSGTMDPVGADINTVISEEEGEKFWEGLPKALKTVLRALILRDPDGSKI